MDWHQHLEATRSRIDLALEGALRASREDALPLPGLDAFYDALRHALKSGGKRVRPTLTLLCAQACHASAEQEADALRAATAIELLHNYTLVHDDLPSMDNDTLRRGLPSVWAQFGEGSAVLAGDFLQALAFAQIAPCHQAHRMLPILATAATHVIHGQVADLEASRLPASQWNRDLLRGIYLGKTASLIRAACALGAVAADASNALCESFMDFGTALGLAFQYQDDILDAEQSPDDNELNALAVFEMNPEAVRQEAERYTRQALNALASVPGDTQILASFATSLLSRAF